MTLYTEKRFAKAIKQQTLPIIRLFTPIFFVVVGLSINLREIDWASSHIWRFTLQLLMAAIIGKLLGAYFLKENWASRLMIGMSMVPWG